VWEDTRGRAGPVTFGVAEAEWSSPLIGGKPPPARGGQTGALIGNLFVMFGGTFYQEKFQYLNDLWVIDTDTMEWHKPKAAGHPPGARYGHSAAVVDTCVYVFGGKGSSKVLFNDLHMLDVVRWTWSLVPSTTAPPLGRFGHSMVAVGDKLVVFGGWDGVSAMNDLWVFDTTATSWIKPVVGGPPPSPRHGHTMVQAPSTGRLIVFGGWSPTDKGYPDYRSDSRELDPETMTWVRSRETGERPGGRYGHAAGMVGGRYMVVLGGWGKNQQAESAAEEASRATDETSKVSAPVTTKQLWVLDTEENKWFQPKAAGRHPGLRYGSSMAVLGPFVLTFGGWDGVKSRSDMVQLDFTPLVGDEEVSDAIPHE
jgi:hypothetical protein